MMLKELEQVLRGYGVAIIQWRDRHKQIKEINTHIHLIKYCNDALLVREVLRVEIKGNDIEVFLK